MVIVYAAGLFTLNETVPPTFALMSVVKPWIVASPEPSTSQTLDGVPGLEFSQTIGFVGAAHGSATLALACGLIATHMTVTRTATTAPTSPGDVTLKLASERAVDPVIPMEAPMIVMLGGSATQGGENRK